MGMYPGATLCYGIAIPDWIDSESLPWYDGSDFDYSIETELARLGLLEVSVAWFGNLGYGETGTILCTKNHRFYAYDPTEISAGDLTVDDSDTELLGQAWAALFPNEVADVPKWMICLTYG